MTILFSLTLFVSAALLFLVQPMVAKMLLPALGGTPNVWITCMLFFQTGLLAGYAYVHAGCRWLGIPWHAGLHLALLVAAFLCLPMDLTGATTGEGDPTGWLLWNLLVAVGLPYVMVSSSGPLLQKWFSMQRAGTDPYFLYAASNLGSFVGLLSYPFAVEPELRLHEQSTMWMWGYAILALLILVCGVPLLCGRPLQTPVSNVVAGPASAFARFRWVLLSLVPSSLMLSVTMYLTTDIASVPLLWVLPIAIYLLSFVLVFARWQLIPHWLILRTMPAAVIVVVFVLLSEATEPSEVLIAVHLLGLFWLCMACHGELARTRPPADRLTEFYLWLAVGGALGGLFNAVVSPMVFNSIAEYPLMLIAACCLRPIPENAPAVRWFDLLFAAGVGVLTVGLTLVCRSLSLDPGPITLGVMFGLPCLAAYTLLDRPLRFGLAIAAIFLAATVYEGVHGRPETSVRSFFGVHRVTLDRAGEYRLLIHGNTLHGQQKISGPSGERRRPLTYYHERSPIGQLLLAYKDDERLNRIALVGLGAGALASYAEKGQHWTFFEIDPAVEKLARSHFTYLGDSKGRIDLVIGDARVMLQEQPDAGFGLIVIDAFSSDSIPVHLLTREALVLYRQKLSKNGLLAFHISNRYLDLQPVLTALARDSPPPMVALYQEGYVTPDDKAQGRLASQWMVLAPQREEVSKLLASHRWEEPRREAVVWTDDYSNVLSVLRSRAAD